MTLRPYFAAMALSLLAASGCDDHSHDDDTEHDHTEHEHDHDGGGASCASLHVGTVIECDDVIDSEGASATEGDYTVTVTSVMPSELEAGADGDFMLMVMIEDAAGDPVSGAELEEVITNAHGGHAACGTPTSSDEGDGMYHVHGLTYPHSGTWVHIFHVGETEIELPLCVRDPG